MFLPRVVNSTDTIAPMTYTIHVDGGSRGNPGPSAAGFIVEDEQGTTVHRQGIFLGRLTNNQAEYHGVVAAFQWLCHHIKRRGSAPASIFVILDSELLVNQLIGVFKIKSPELRQLAIRAKSLELSLGIPVSYRHVRREENTNADRLVNIALDQSEKEFDVKRGGRR